MTREHGGVEMDLAFGSVKPYGSSRSIVRRIAANLPLKPCPRAHFQLHPYSEAADRRYSSAEQYGFVASLADVAWIERGADDAPARLGLGVDAEPGFIFFSHQRQSLRPLKRRRSLPSIHQEVLDPSAPAFGNQEAIQKISALENELAKLRAQIAQIVSAQEQNAQAAVPPGERRGQKMAIQATLDPGPKQPDIPNMLDVLKDMGKVKLRSVNSRPQECPAKLKPSDPNDAASLIAEALKTQVCSSIPE
ncbi:hypothetical protein GJAV_G00078420 [Gymnothorax javanicus]|nr:hypothetical protein GJAV_G00078420 [Gymnothorax javanicus]